MKILVDMNLSPRWAATLIQADIEALHWTEVGPANTPDPAIMAYAEKNGFTILTNDLDFGIALATTNRKIPSVVQIRGEALRPELIAGQVIRALKQMHAELEEGALLTVDPKRTRLRLLPLGKKT